MSAVEMQEAANADANGTIPKECGVAKKDSGGEEESQRWSDEVLTAALMVERGGCGRDRRWWRRCGSNSGSSPHESRAKFKLSSLPPTRAMLDRRSTLRDAIRRMSST